MRRNFRPGADMLRRNGFRNCRICIALMQFPHDSAWRFAQTPGAAAGPKTLVGVPVSC